jgi:hypothetical protein
MRIVLWITYLFAVATAVSGCSSETVEAKPKKNPTLAMVVVADAVAEEKLTSVPDLPDSIKRGAGLVPPPIDGPSEEYTLAMIVLPRKVTGYYIDNCPGCSVAKREGKSLDIKFHWTKKLTPGMAKMVQDRLASGGTVMFPIFHWLATPEEPVHLEGWPGPVVFRSVFEQSRVVKVAAERRTLAGTMPSPFGQLLGDGPFLIPTGGRRSMQVGDALLTFGPDISGQVQGSAVTLGGTLPYATVKKLGIPISATISKVEVGAESFTAKTGLGRFTFPIPSFESN